MVSVKFISRLFKSVFLRNYRIIVLENSKDDLVVKSYNFRYQMYCMHDKLLDFKNYSDNKEYDEYDKCSVHVIAIDKDNNIVGMLRLIKHSDLTFPTIKEFDLYKIIEGIDLNKVVEVSRIIVAPDYRKTFLLIDLLKTAAHYSKKKNIEYWTGCVEIWFYKSLTKLFGHIELVAEPKYCFNAMNYPFIFKLSDLRKNLWKNNLFLYFLLRKYI